MLVPTGATKNKLAVLSRFVIYAILLTGLLLLPFLIKGYWLRLATSVLMYVTVAESINIIAGYAGYPALGNMVFFGSGAYVTAVAMQVFRLPFLISFLLAGALSALYALAIGIPVLRLRGRYFLMATIGLLEVSREVAINMNITGGSKGINLPLVPGDPETAYILFFYIMLGLSCACLATVIWIQKSRIGFALRAIKFDEDAALVMGINSTMYKIIAWTISAFFTGLAGGTFAYWMSFIEPKVVFDIVTSVKAYLMFVFGGAGTIWGPAIGATFLELVSELIWSKFLEWHYMVLGAVMVAAALFMPSGVTGLLRTLIRKSSAL